MAGVLLLRLCLAAVLAFSVADSQGVDPLIGPPGGLLTNAFSWGADLRGESGRIKSVDRPYPIFISNGTGPDLDFAQQARSALLRRRQSGNGTTASFTTAPATTATTAAPTTGAPTTGGAPPTTAGGTTGSLIPTTAGGGGTTAASVTTGASPSTPPWRPPDETIVAAAAGTWLSMLLDSNGVAYAFGKNDYGQTSQTELNGTYYNETQHLGVHAVELPPSIQGTVTAIGTGWYHSMLVSTLANGHIWAWGDNSEGQLGLGTTGGHTQVPTEVNPGPGSDFSSERVKEVHGGASHSLALTESEKIFATGDNSRGQLGNGGFANSNLFERISTLTGPFAAICVGAFHNVVVKTNGEVWVWGSNSFGELGGATALGTERSPVLLNPNSTGLLKVDEKIIGCAAGAYHTLLLADSGRTVLGFGSDANLQLGQNNESATRDYYFSEPLEVDLSALAVNETVKQLSAGLAGSGFVTDFGRVFTFGTACFGTVVLGRDGCGKIAEPVQFSPIEQEADYIVMGAFHTIVLSKGNRTSFPLTTYQPTCTSDSTDFCQRGPPPVPLTPPPPPAPEADTPEASSDGSTIILSLVFVFVAILVCLLLGVLFLVWYRSRVSATHSEKEALKHSSRTSATDSYENLFELDASETAAGGASPGKNARKSRGGDLQRIPSEDVEFGKVLGQGNFGAVYHAMWNEVEVACKAVAIEGIDESETKQLRSELVNEMSLLRQLSHPACVQFHGIVFGPQDPKDSSSVTMPWFVLEYMPDGSLEGYLKKKPQGLTRGTRLQILAQLASGMVYLHKQNVLHRDLACRNVLLKKSGRGAFDAKLTDFGLSRREENEYVATQSQMPIRWSAVESLKHREFSKASDVWQFAILSVECFSGAVIPYSHLSTKEVVEAVVNRGERPARPTDNGPGGAVDVPDSVWGLLEQCWQAEPRDRPSFAHVLKILRASAGRGLKAPGNSGSPNSSGGLSRNSYQVSDPIGEILYNTTEPVSDSDENTNSGGPIYHTSPEAGVQGGYQTTDGSVDTPGTALVDTPADYQGL